MNTKSYYILKIIKSYKSISFIIFQFDNNDYIYTIYDKIFSIKN